METLKCDAKGRIYLKEQVRKKYGKEFVLLEARDELILLPVPKDPLKALQEMGKKLPKDMTVKQIREEAREAMMKEIEEEL